MEKMQVGPHFEDLGSLVLCQKVNLLGFLQERGFMKCVDSAKLDRDQGKINARLSPGKNHFHAALYLVFSVMGYSEVDWTSKTYTER